MEERKKPTSSLHLNAREVAMVGETTSSSHLDARVVVGGMLEKRWWWRETCQDASKTSFRFAFGREGSGGHWWEACWKKEKDHLQLAFGCEGGGDGKRRVEWWWEACWKKEKNHLRLAFECEGGGGSERRVETPKNASGSRLDAREVVVGGM